MKRWQLRARICLALLALACLAMGGAAYAYAGGSWLHPSAASYHFFENYWCDLLRDPAHNGRPNLISLRLASLAFSALGGALGAFWLELAELLEPGPGRFVRRAGSLSALATLTVALVPSDRFPGLHVPAVLSAGGLGLACGFICSAWAVRHFRQGPSFALCSLFLLAAAITNLALYVRVSLFAGPNTIVLPAVQKLATLGLVAWMLTGLSLAARLKAAGAAGSGFSANRPKP